MPVVHKQVVSYVAAVGVLVEMPWPSMAMKLLSRQLIEIPSHLGWPAWSLHANTSAATLCRLGVSNKTTTQTDDKQVDDVEPGHVLKSCERIS